MGNLELDAAKLMRYIPSDVEFTKNGKKGWKSKAGKILIPAEYDQIERCADCLYVCNGMDYELYYKDGGAEAFYHDYSVGSFFVKRGKFGWRKKNKVVIPANYDQIVHWSDNLFAVKKGNRCFYINDKCEEVLTNVRHYNDEEDFPFEFSSHDSDIITLQEYVGHQVKSDPNVVKIGSWVRLDRITDEEIKELLINPKDEAPITERDLDSFNSKFSYEFNAYMAKSKANEGIAGCLEKMEKMNAYCNSWFYIVKVWKAVGEEPSAEELRNLRYFMNNKRYFGDIIFGLGHEPKLKAGETKMFMVTHYNEECFPPSFQYEWHEYLNEYTLSEIKERMPIQRNIVEKEVLPEYQEEVWGNHFTGEIANMGFTKERSWEETAKVLDFLKAYDDSFANAIKGTVGELFSYYEVNSPEKDTFLLNKLEWLLENGANVNSHRGNQTALDLIRDYLSENDEDKKYNEESVKRCREILHLYGAKSMDEIRREEEKNDDYRKELELLKPSLKKIRTFSIM